mmetsp:Transcript_11610/g.17333  ORF Transcript_11610/g.17333 Transcript_11610/m.17333 type:complete len:566 (-) Transcript_11610:217-1914(-)
MCQGGIEVRIKHLNILVRAYAKENNMKGVQHIIRRFKEFRIQVSTSTFNSILTAKKERREYPPLEFLDIMRENGVEPSNVTFGILLEMHLQKKLFKEVPQVMAKFSKLGMEPTTQIYNILLKYAKTKSTAQAILTQMREKYLEPDVYTVMALHPFGMVPNVNQCDIILNSFRVPLSPKILSSLHKVYGVCGNYRGVYSIYERKKGLEDRILHRFPEEEDTAAVREVVRMETDRMIHESKRHGRRVYAKDIDLLELFKMAKRVNDFEYMQKIFLEIFREGVHTHFSNEKDGTAARMEHMRAIAMTAPTTMQSMKYSLLERQELKATSWSRHIKSPSSLQFMNSDENYSEWKNVTNSTLSKYAPNEKFELEQTENACLIHCASPAGAQRVREAFLQYHIDYISKYAKRSRHKYVCTVVQSLGKIPEHLNDEHRNRSLSYGYVWIKIRNIPENYLTDRILSLFGSWGGASEFRRKGTDGFLRMKSPAIAWEVNFCLHDHPLDFENPKGLIAETCEAPPRSTLIWDVWESQPYNSTVDVELENSVEGEDAEVEDSEVRPSTNPLGAEVC